MSTNDVPGARAVNNDVLAMGCWAEHDDGSLIFVESTEAERVVYSIFDVSLDPPVEYRGAMPEAGFKSQFSWTPDKPEPEKKRGRKAKDDDVKDDVVPKVKWTWHDKTPFPWDRVFEDFPEGQRPASAVATITAAQRVAESLHLRAGAVRKRHEVQPTEQRPARTIMHRIADAIDALRR